MSTLNTYSDYRWNLFYYCPFLFFPPLFLKAVAVFWKAIACNILNKWRKRIWTQIFRWVRIVRRVCTYRPVCTVADLCTWICFHLQIWIDIVFTHTYTSYHAHRDLDKYFYNGSPLSPSIQKQQLQCELLPSVTVMRATQFLLHHIFQMQNRFIPGERGTSHNITLNNMSTKRSMWSRHFNVLFFVIKSFICWEIDWICFH